MNSQTIGIDEKLDFDRTIYISNIVQKTLLFQFDDKAVKLSGPGTAGSVQILDRDMLKSPAFSAMRSAGMFVLSYDTALANEATDKLVQQFKEEEKRTAEDASKVNAVDDGITDVTDSIVDSDPEPVSDPVQENDDQSDDQNDDQNNDPEPVKKPRGRRKASN